MGPLLAELAPYKFYFIGVGGSLAAELAAAIRESSAIGGRCPPLYKAPFYLAMRLLFALGVAGPLPYLIDAANNLTAFYMGLTAPFIIERLSKGQMPGAGEPSAAPHGPPAPASLPKPDKAAADAAAGP